jgi:hypothetical protein
MLLNRVGGLTLVGDEVRLSHHCRYRLVYSRSLSCGDTFWFVYSTAVITPRVNKFGNINNNELLIINLAAVRAGRISNTSSSHSMIKTK